MIALEDITNAEHTHSGVPTFRILLIAANRPAGGHPDWLSLLSGKPSFYSKKLTTHRHTDHITPLSNLLIMQEMITRCFRVGQYNDAIGFN
jgi:hypothetical protein